MKIEDIKKNYPKSYLLLVEYIKKDLKQVDKESIVLTIFPIDKIIDLLFSSTIQKRKLFDFFDETDVFISVLSGEDDWIATINEDEIMVTRDTRIKVEEEIFYEAFSVLEEQLD